MSQHPEIVALFLWLILIFVSVAFEEGYSKRVPSDKLRFPHCFAALGIGLPFACGWLIYEMFHAGDWEQAKLFYLLLGIPFFALVGLGGVWMVLHAINWGIDIKEDRIVYRNMFRHTRTIYYSKIIRIEHRSPRFVAKSKSRFHRSVSQIGVNRRIAFQKSMGSYRIYIGRRSIKVNAAVYHYDGSAARILKAMKKQGIQCPVTTKKTWFA